jgi:iron complex transport system substrate-binding protein
MLRDSRETPAGNGQADRGSSRRRFLESVASFAVVGAAGCLGTGGSGSPPTTNEPRGPTTVEDATARTVEIPETVEDIVAVGPGMLNLVAYLDATDMVVGVEEPEHSWAKNIPYNIANPELRDRQVIGPHKGGDAELIVGADPDVVVATYFTAGTASDLQSKIDRPVVVVKSESRPLHRLDRAYEDIEFLAEIIGKHDRAETVVDFFESERETLDELSQGIQKSERPVAYYAGRSDSGGAGVTSTQHPFAPFSFVNVDNAADAIEGHAEVNEEKLHSWDPEVIFIAGSNLDRVTDALSAETYANVTAIEEGNLYSLLPTRFYGNLYGNVLVDAYYVGSVLYPDAFSDIDLDERADEVYQSLFGTAIYDDVTERMDGISEITL